MERNKTCVNYVNSERKRQRQRDRQRGYYTRHPRRPRGSQLGRVERHSESYQEYMAKNKKKGSKLGVTKINTGTVGKSKLQ